MNRPNPSTVQGYVGRRWLAMARGFLLAGLWTGGTLAVGCNTVSGEKYMQVQRELQASKEHTTKLESQLSDEQKTVRNLQKQVATARGLSTETLQELASPVRIDLASQSGGYDLDKKTGDDGIALYIKPIDKDGDVIKAIGSIRVTLLDLSEPTSPQVISTYDFDMPTTKKQWYGRFMTQHYTIRCPWPPGKLPKTDKVTAIVEFTDLLTGRVLTAQKTFDVKLPPVLATKPAA